MSCMVESGHLPSLQPSAGGSWSAVSLQPKQAPSPFSSAANTDVATQLLRKLKSEIAYVTAGSEQQLPTPRTAPHVQAQPLCDATSSSAVGFKAPTSPVPAYVAKADISSAPEVRTEAAVRCHSHRGKDLDSPAHSCSSSFESPHAHIIIPQQQQAVKRSVARTWMLSDLQKQYKLARQRYIQLKQSAAAKRNSSRNGVSSSPLKATSSPSKPQMRRSKPYRLLHGLQSMQYPPEPAPQLAVQQQQQQQQQALGPAEDLQHTASAASQPLPALTVVVNMLLHITAARASPAAAVQLRQQLLQQIRVTATAAQQQQQPFSVADALRAAIPQLIAAVKEICAVSQQQQQQYQFAAAPRNQSLAPASAAQTETPIADHHHHQQQQQQQHNLPDKGQTKLQAEQIQLRDKLTKWRQQQQQLQPLMPKPHNDQHHYTAMRGHQQQQQQQQRRRAAAEPSLLPAAARRFHVQHSRE